MKNSDSKNSLAELNPPEPICFVCLEEGTPDAPLIPSSLLRSCTCKFHTHTDCWNRWQKGKSDYDCPYCSKRSLHISLPMTAPFQQNYSSYIQEQQHQKRFCTPKKCIVICVVTALLTACFLAFFLQE